MRGLTSPAYAALIFSNNKLEIRNLLAYCQLEYLNNNHRDGQ